jgi:hypothetical protein
MSHEQFHNYLPNFVDILGPGSHNHSLLNRIDTRCNEILPPLGFHLYGTYSAGPIRLQLLMAAKGRD